MNFLSKNKISKSQEEKKKLRSDRILLVLSGILIGISFSPFPFPFTLLLFVGFIPFLFVLERRKTLAEINRAEFIMTFVLCLITVYWVGSWQSEADPFLMMGGGALLFALPCVLLIPTTLYYLSVKVFKPQVAFWFFPLFWVTAEYLLTLTDLKFPWVVMGNGLAKFTIFIQAADIIGTFGLSLVVLYINLLLYKSFLYYKEKKKISFHFILATAIFLTFIFYGFYKTSTFQTSDKKIRVGIIQPNLNPWKKWETGNLMQMVHNYLELSQKAVDGGAQIILWPETALPVYLMSSSYIPEIDTIYKFLDENDVPLLTGMPHIKFYFDSSKAPADVKFAKEGDYYYATYNSILLLEPGNRKFQQYGKMQLVPLGEHVPFAEQFSFLADMFKWGVGLTGWNVGKDTTVFNTTINIEDKRQTIKIGGLVCYESIFPIFVTSFVKRGAEFLAVVTNDSWYGNSSGPRQHRDFAIMRAVENRRTVVRCANGGISCIINPLGEIETQTDMFSEAVLVGNVGLHNENTFYTEHPSIITMLVSTISLGIVLLSIILFIKQKFKL